MREGIPVSRLMLIQNASDSISPPSPPSMRTRISHHRWRCPNTSAAVAARPEIRSGGSGRRWCGAPPRPGAFCRSPGRDRVPASPAQVGAGLRTPQGRERTPVPACKIADSELRRDAGVQVCEVVENASGLDPAAVGGESLSCTRTGRTGPSSSKSRSTAPGPDSHRQATTCLRPKITYTRSPPICWSRERGIGEAHRVAGGRPQVCINFKMVGQVLEKRGIAAAFAKSVADVCDTLAAATSRLAADHPRPTDEATAECFRPMDQVVQGSS